MISLNPDSNYYERQLGRSFARFTLSQIIHNARQFVKHGSPEHSEHPEEAVIHVSESYGWSFTSASDTDSLSHIEHPFYLVHMDGSLSAP